MHYQIIDAKKNILVIQKQGNNLIIRLTIYVSEITINLPPLRIPRLRHHRVTDWDPYFENADGQGINGSQNVALHLGATAYLDCRVAMLSGKKVCYIKLLAIKLTLLRDQNYNIIFKYIRNYNLFFTALLQIIIIKQRFTNLYYSIQTSCLTILVP